mgnify:CR=1 FL=1
MERTYSIKITGQVQGVGFRPYVFSLAKEYFLKGTVSNNEQGVVINVTGVEKAVFNFYKKLVQFPPPVAKIKSSFIHQIEFIFFKDFTIVPSKKQGAIQLMLTPDFAICSDCKKEIIDKENRRFNYPFTTCVNCGPRWAITESFPFERNHTSIDEFPMCEECKKEYTNPVNRRFHSQTNTCQVCGIELFLRDNKGENIQVQSSKIFLRLPYYHL